MSEFYPDDEDRVINSPVEELTTEEIRWEILKKAKNDLVLAELLKTPPVPAGADYLSLNYGENIHEWFEGDAVRICELLDEYSKRMQPVDFRHVRFKRELQSITNGADPNVLIEEQLNRLIKLLFARQREVGRDSDEGEEINAMLSELRSSSREAEALFDTLEEKLNY